MQHHVTYFHRDIVNCAFESLAKYDLQIHKYCGERPSINGMSADEIYSDLILDRFPAFILNCRLGVQLILQILDADFSAVRDEHKLKKNLQAILPDKSPEATRQLERLLQLEMLQKKEKKFLAFLRSCVKRTKMSYNQKIKRTKRNFQPLNGEFLTTQSNSPVEATPAEEREFAKAILERSNLTETEVDMMMSVVVDEIYFKDLGDKLNVSRQTAARRYLELIGRIRGYGS